MASNATLPNDDNYNAPSFRSSSGIDRTHGVWRFGHTNDIVALASDDDRMDYVAGIVGCGVAIFCIYLVWSIMLLVMKCCGGKRCGCGAGVPPTRPSLETREDKMTSLGTNEETAGNTQAKQQLSEQLGESAELSAPLLDREEGAAFQDEDDGSYEYHVEAAELLAMTRKRIERKVAIIRTFFLISGMLVLVFSIVLIVEGLGGINSSIDSVKNNFGVLESLLGHASSAVGRFIIASAAFVKDANDFISNRDQWCPAIGANSTSIEIPTENGTIIEVDFSAVEDAIVAIINISQVLIAKDMVDLKSGIDETKDDVRGFQDSIGKTSWWWYVAVTFILLIVIMAIVFMTGTILAWRGRQPKQLRFAQDYAVLPIFIIFGLLMWVFTTGFFVTGVLVSDFCYVTPDMQLARILQLSFKKNHSEAFSFVYYYITGCLPSRKPDILITIFDELEDGVQTLHSFLEALKAVGTDGLIKACGGVSLASATATVLSQGLDNSVPLLVDVASVGSCKSINPLYVGIFHDTICNHGANAFVWIYASMFIISICSMIMVTLRVAWRELEDEEMAHSQDQSNGASCCECWMTKECWKWPNRPRSATNAEVI